MKIYWTNIFGPGSQLFSFGSRTVLDLDLGIVLMKLMPLWDGVISDDARGC